MGPLNDIFDLLTGGFNRLNKFAKGQGVYNVFEYDLSIARSDIEENFMGNHLIVTECGDEAFLKLNDKKNASIPIDVIRNIESPYRNFYLTNDAGEGTLKILAGSGGIFRGNSIAVDLDRQTANRIVIRDNDGVGESSEETLTVCAVNSETSVHSYSGSGSLRYVLFNQEAKQDCDSMEPRIYIDGTVLEPVKTFNAWNNLGFNTATKPFQLLDFGIDDKCTLLAYFDKGIVFDTSLEFSYYNHSNLNTQTPWTYWFYQIIS